jgi:cob(I)alamin adenosyltransferase
MKERGLIHIYFGDGKGKTTAACGLALRALGRNRKVFLFFFFKRPSDSSEIQLLLKLKNLKISCFAKTHPFFVKKNKPFYRRRLKPKLNVFLKKVKTTLKKEEVDLVVMDEILTAIKGGLVTEKELINLLKEKNNKTEVILTGRPRPSRKILMLADYVSEIRSLKHPYEEGLCAREGIDF